MTEPDDDEGKERLVVRLRERMSDVEPLAHEDFFTRTDTLHRFLKARDWNVENAERQLKDTVEWRRQMDPVNIDCRWCHERPGYHCIVGFDKQRRPVMYCCFAQSSCLDTTVDDSVIHMTHLFENAKITMVDGVSMWVFVVDCTGMTLSACNPRVGYGICNAMATYYPERLGLVVCIHHNPVFQGVWNAFKVFLDPNTAAKMQMVRKKAKFRDVFYRLFDDELATWLMDEVKLNKCRPMPTSQRQFWTPADVELEAVETSPTASRKERIQALARTHDPRGCLSYVQQYIDPYVDQSTNGDASPSTRHQPHPNIVDALRGTIASDVSSPVGAAPATADIVFANGSGDSRHHRSDASGTSANSDDEDDELQSPISVSDVNEQFHVPKHVFGQHQLKHRQQHELQHQQ